jgi:dipeptidyl aminopeptidase/acylaminoacyl peptidase
MGSGVVDLEALLRVPYVDPDYGFSLSPDGSEVAFAYNRTGQWEIYRLSLDKPAAPEQVTRGPGAKLAPRWSPDGQRLAYVVDLDGGEVLDIYVYDQGKGQHINLTPDTPDSIQPNYAWSPDGTEMAFISNRSGCFHTYIMRATGGPPRPVLRLPHPNWEVRWSADGRWLTVVVEASGQDYATYIVPASGGEAQAIGHNGQWIPAKDACWSPDGRRVAFASNSDGTYDIGVYDVADGGIKWVSRGHGDKETPVWSPDGQRLAYVRSDGPVTRLAVLDLGNMQVSEYQVEAGVHYRPRFTRDGAHLVAVFDSPRHPDDLWLLSLTEGAFRPLTRSLPLELQSRPLATPDAVRYPSLDGSEVPALLYVPSDARQRSAGPGPGVIYVHGGPNWLTQVTWDPLVQHMVSRGWVVLAPNYRGSTGYGRAWQLANRFDLGGGDTQDVVAGADYLVRKGLADPARIAVTGRSYGGYLTMTSLTQYPDRWAAGSAVVPFLNWFTGHANSREDLQHWDLENFGDPEKDHDLYRERSPFFFLDRVAAPVQLICGAHDPRCPASESVQTHDALVAQGKTCDMVLYPDEGHSFLKVENVVDAKKRRAAFLAGVLERA